MAVSFHSAGLATLVGGYLSEAERVFDEEMSALARARSRLDKSLGNVIHLILRSPGKVVVTGLGKSGIIAHKIASTLASTGTPAVYMNAAEALHGDLGVVLRGDVVIMISKSGSTSELARMLPSLRHLNASIIGILGDVTTQLSARCDFVLDASVESEACPLALAPTCSSTVALVIGDAIAVCLMRARKFTSEQFAVFHPDGSLGRRLLFRARDVMHVRPNLPVVCRDATLREIALEMTRTNLGGVCVCSADSQLLGIITDGDLRRNLLSDDAFSAKAADLMHRDPIFGKPDDTLGHLLSVMQSSERKVYVLPIVDPDRRYIGFVRMHDILSSH
jgi:arabinose-5-phosphate isomerase